MLRVFGSAGFCWALIVLISFPREALSRFTNLNLRPDTDNAPFLHGVASGDPLNDRVLIWTRVTPAAGVGMNDSLSLNWAVWEVNSSQSFETPLFNGTGNTSFNVDFTITVDVIGLNPDTKYFYQFQDENGNSSVVGTTRTLPVGDVENVNVAITSCTKLQAGYMNAYRHVSKQDDIAFVAHVGDYIYPQHSYECNRFLYGTCDNKEEFNWFQKCKEFQDADPSASNGNQFLDDFASSFQCQENSLLERSRWVHAFYLLDPDFRAAKQAHPFIVQFDNHDVDGTGGEFKDDVQAFLEWVPVRFTIEGNVVNTSRNFELGNLADFVIIDTQSFREKEVTLLGNEQEQWFGKQLAESNSTWRLIGSPKMVVPYAMNGFPKGISLVFCFIWLIILSMLSLCCCLEYAYTDIKVNEDKTKELSHYEVKVDDNSSVPAVDTGVSCFGKVLMHRAYNIHRSSPKLLRRCTLCGFCSVCTWLLVWLVLGIVLSSLPILTGEGDEIVYLSDSVRVWGGHYESLKLMFAQMEENGADYNNVFLTGDMHFTVLADVVDFDESDASTLLDYEPSASPDKTNKRYGVEFLPASGTSPNVDEKIELVLGWDGALKWWLTSVIEFLTRRSNPHFRKFNGRDHGYGILRLNEERINAEVYYHDKFVLGDEAELSIEGTIKSMENRWSNIKG
mmetsp:Transcript_14356/g.18860  ORF Transcript_14356/g.18860 Transcript_14356/m.18860 type:complete len:676 (+) Transcript_14356:104-2131(+)